MRTVPSVYSDGSVGRTKCADQRSVTSGFFTLREEGVDFFPVPPLGAFRVAGAVRGAEGTGGDSPASAVADSLGARSSTNTGGGGGGDSATTAEVVATDAVTV